MKRILLSIVAALAAGLLTSCLQNETTIRLNKDGSGTLVEETTLGAQALAMLEQMAAMGGGAPGDDPLADMASEEKAKARAADLGEGVTVAKIEPLERNGARGARVTYQFEDINKLRLAPGDAAKTVMPDMPGAAVTAAEDAEPITFSYEGGKLVVNLPQPEPKPAGSDEVPEMNAEENPQMEAMLKEMLGDMKMALRIVAEPGIDKTDATHRDGNTVTLMEMDMGKLLQEEGALKKLTSIDQSDPEAAMKALRGLEGAKVESKRQIEIVLE